MLQRLQSLYLLIAMAAVILMIFFPYAQITISQTSSYQFYVKGIYSESSELIQATSVLLIMAVFISSLFLSIIFSYKNRKRQLSLCILQILFLLIFMSLLFFYKTNFNSEANSVGLFLIPFYLPLFSIVFILLARRAIKKDDELVKSVDRIR